MSKKILIIGLIIVGVVLICGYLAQNTKLIDTSIPDTFIPIKDDKSVPDEFIPDEIVKQAEKEIGAPPATTPFSGPGLMSPPNKTTTNNFQITFGWYNIDGAEKYLIQIDNTSDFSSPEIEIYVEYSQFKPENPLSDDIYYWRVKTIYKTGEQSEWSDIFKITIFTIL